MHSILNRTSVLYGVAGNVRYFVFHDHFSHFCLNRDFVLAQIHPVERKMLKTGPHSALSIRVKYKKEVTYDKSRYIYSATLKLTCELIVVAQDGALTSCFCRCLMSKASPARDLDPGDTPGEKVFQSFHLSPTLSPLGTFLLDEIYTRLVNFR